MRILIWALCGLLGLPGFAPARSEESPLRITSQPAAARIPVELWDSLTFVHCRVNGSDPAWFVFDTGATINVLDLDFAKTLHLDLSDKQKHPRSGQEVILAHDLTFSLPGVELRGQTAMVVDLGDLALFAGHPIAGVFGYEWLRGAVVELDYAGKAMGIFDDRGPAAPLRAEQLPLAVVGKWPVIGVRLEQAGLPPVENRIILDSGSLMAVSLTSGSLAKTTVELPATAGVTGVGAAANRVGRLSSLTIGKWTFREVPAAFPPAGTPEPPDYLTKAVASTGVGLVGVQVMSRFRFIFDYRRQTVWVAANPGWDKPFEWDRSGAIFMSADRSFQGFTVIGVTPGAPAAEAGLMPGDVVVAVNGRPAAEFTLPEFRAMMTRDGTRVVLRIKRGEEVKEAAFKPRTLI